MRVSAVKSLLVAVFVTPLIFAFGMGSGDVDAVDLIREDGRFALDTGDPDSLRYPIPENGDGGLYLNNPSNFRDEVTYDPETGLYTIQKYVGNVPVGSPLILTADQYKDRVFTNIDSQYWPQRVQQTSRAESFNNAEGDRESESLIPDININSQAFADIFGGNTIEIRPQGTAELRFGARYQKIENPIIPIRNQRTFAFDFDQRIQINITGKIGTRLSLGVNYDTEATFAFENKMKLGFEGEEDDIIKNLEMGNVSLPVNSSLITGAQSLFGVKGKFQFGKTTVTGVFSEQRSQSQSINVQGGATQQEFEIWADQYEANRHYFLSQYFRSHYEEWLASMPVVNSPVQITKVEVWVTNRRSVTQDVRNVVAFLDLGENQTNAYRDGTRPLPGPSIFPGQSTSNFPNNAANQLNPSDLVAQYPGVRDIGDVNATLNAAGFVEATEYVELTNARKLQPSQYKLDPQLGILSLNESLNQDEILAVSFQYTAYGQTYQVGEFSTDGVNPPSTLILKMLKSTILDVKSPVWDLMMKNVYSLGAFQVSQEDFRLQVMYMNDETGTPVPFLPNSNLDDTLLLNLMSLDQLNFNNDPIPDGSFDFVDGRTINSQNGRIFFPVLEPFGERIAKNLNSQEAIDKYAFQELYDSTRFRAQAMTQKNKYLLKGQYKSASGSVIQLNAFNIPQGSVTVSAGGAKLVENQDYTVDYNLGQVRIINESIMNSGVPINVSFENNSLFNFQTKTFAGATFDHRISDNFNVGGAILHLRERPLTQKVNLGDEPIANTIWGLNTQYSTDAPFLTRMVDAIPFIDTKEPSSINFQGEFAHMIPGSPSGIKIGDDGATTYIDDFESSQTNIDIRGATSWAIASTPAGQPELFPEGNLSNDLAYNFNRAKLAWYIIDPVFYSDNAQTPDNIRSDKRLISDHRTRKVDILEVFPNTSLQQGTTVRNIAMFDLAYYPEERGPYNYDVQSNIYSAGINADGHLNDPESRWAGIMRPLQINNFEEQNIEFIQFWMMDPYAELDSVNTQSGGDLYFNLGSVSEDILKDGRQSFENGLDVNGAIEDLDSTVWGYTSQNQPIVDAFDNDPASRPNQDLGLDGLGTPAERDWRYMGQPSYMERVENQFGAGSGAWAKANADPSGDDFVYYRGSDLDNASAGILGRYKNFNGTEGNSSITQVDGYPAFATNLPDKEDVNRDLTLSKTETYYQYRVSMRYEDLQTPGQNYITDIYETTVTTPDDRNRSVRWIQFKIPIREPDKRIGQISDFRSIRFIRMFMKGFSESTVLRFARLDLVRGEWRRYQFDLNVLNESVPIDPDQTTVFNVNAVNLEENGARDPIPYTLPPGIDRQQLFGTTSTVQANEQSLSLYTCGLADGDARAVFRNLTMDMRMYGNLKMFAHAEAGAASEILRDGDVNLFIRVGSDYNNNYYEFELPLQVTQWGASDPDQIWPEANNLDLDLDMFKDIKLERDRVMQGNPNFTRQTLYSVEKNGGTVSVLGSPNLGNVRTIMIGIRNPKKRLNDASDDGMPKCAEVWVNELRLTDFNNQGGWAANARMTAKLADFANVSMTGNYSSVGYGSLDQGPQDRNQFEALSYNLQTNVEMGKFFNDDIALRIPVFFNLSEEWKNPMFNPLDPDIEFPTALENLETTAQRDSLKALSQDYTLRRDINFTNVRKERTGTSTRRPQFYDIENFSVSYSFSEVYRRNVNTQLDRRVDHRGTLNYSYQVPAKPYKPFEDLISSKYLTLIKDFNFQLYPQRFSFRGDVLRSYQQLQMRNVENTDPRFALPMNWNKNFTMDRNYTLAWDLTERIKIDFTALQRVRFDELAGAIDKTENQEYLKQNLMDLGRPTNYHQTLQVSWQLPIDKIPFLEFINASLRYTGDYDWQAISLRARQDTALNYGNTIQNSATWQANVNLNMSTLYNKFPFIQRLSQPPGGNNRRVGPVRRQLPGSNPRAANDDDGSGDDSGDGFGKSLARFGVGLLTMVKNVTGTYSLNQGTLLPGYLPDPVFFGMSDVNGWMPGVPFVLGWQTPVAQQLAGLELSNNPELTKDSYLTQKRGQPNRYTEMENSNLQIRGTVEPISDLRIDINFTKTTGYNYSSVFRYIGDDPDDQVLRDAFGTGFQFLNPMAVNTYSISWLAWGSAFEPSGVKESAVYDQFLENRFVVSERLASNYSAQDPNYTATFDPDSGYSGYSVYSQQAMIPAFISAYGGAPADQIGLTLADLPKIPMPNWRLNYTGLMRLDWFKEKFSSFSLSSSYNSTLQVANYQTNLLREQAILENPGTNPKDLSGDFMSEYQVSQVSMTESFRPLVGFNMRMKNNTTFKIDYNRDRNIAMSMANQQITDTKGNELTIGAGYVIKDVKFNFITTGASRTPVNSNLELRVDLSIRDNITVIRQIAQNKNQVTAGQRLTTIKFTADYKISRRITAQFYYDQNIAKFKTSSAFPTNRVQTGISIRLSLAN